MGDNAGPDFSSNPFLKYVVDGTTPCIERAAAELGSISQRRRYSTYEEITLALAFAQAIRYSYDEDTVGRVDYWRYPIEP